MSTAPPPLDAERRSAPRRVERRGQGAGPAGRGGRRGMSARAIYRRRLVRISLMSADSVGLIMAFVVSGMVHSGSMLNSAGGSPSVLGWTAMVIRLPLALAIAASYRMYSFDEVRSTQSTAHEFGRIFQFVSSLALLELVAEIVGAAVIFRPSTERLVTFWLLAVVLIAVLRACARVFVRRMPTYDQRVLIIGAGSKVDRLVEALQRDRRYGMRVVRVLGPNGGRAEDRAAIDENLARYLEEVTRGLRADRVIVVDDAEFGWDLEETVRGLYGLGVIIDISPQVSEVFSTSTEMHDVQGISLLAVPYPHLSLGATVTKRLLDLIVGGLMLLMLAPLFLVVAVAIRHDSRGPVFYRQTRVGKRGRLFGMFKFRTMVDGADAQRPALLAEVTSRDGEPPSLFKLENDPRVTRVGRFLRRHSLDEIPQLINVLMGQMSLVGPRPLLPEEDRYVRGWGTSRGAIPPGMTGLWQVSGSNDISFTEMVGLDYSYVSSWTIWSDFRVMVQTIPIVVGGSRVDR
jgi:exopolysaccharide biosynthesis polyprenyl glycosylphosphotransferase